MNRNLIEAAHTSTAEKLRQATEGGEDCIWAEQPSFQASIAIHRLRLVQASFALSSAPELDRAQWRRELQQALIDFVKSIELGYIADDDEVSLFFYAGLGAGKISLAHFLACLHPDTWPMADHFLSWQAFFGFSVLRGEENRTKCVLQYLQGLCFDGEAGADHSARAEFNRASWFAFDALARGETAIFSERLWERVDLWPKALTAAQSEDCLYLYDLTAVGILKLALMRGLAVSRVHPGLPIGLLDAGLSQAKR